MLVTGVQLPLLLNVTFRHGTDDTDKYCCSPFLYPPAHPCCHQSKDAQKDMKTLFLCDWTSSASLCHTGQCQPHFGTMDVCVYGTVRTRVCHPSVLGFEPCHGYSAKVTQHSVQGAPSVIDTRDGVSNKASEFCTSTSSHSSSRNTSTLQARSASQVLRLTFPSAWINSGPR